MIVDVAALAWGLPESEDITDTDLVKEILTVLDIETTPTSIVRLGKKPEVPPPRNEAAAVDNDNAIGNIAIHKKEFSCYLPILKAIRTLKKYLIFCFC